MARLSDAELLLELVELPRVAGASGTYRPLTPTSLDVTGPDPRWAFALATHAKSAAATDARKICFMKFPAFAQPALEPDRIVIFARGQTPVNP